MNYNADVGIAENIFDLFFAPLTVILLCVVSSGIYYGSGRIFGGVGDFAPTFSVMLYSFVITSLGSLIQYFMANATNNLMFSFSPAVFLDIKTANPWLYNLLTPINLIHILVLIFLIVTRCKSSTNTAVKMPC